MILQGAYQMKRREKDSVSIMCNSSGVIFASNLIENFSNKYPLVTGPHAQVMIPFPLVSMHALFAGYTFYIVLQEQSTVRPPSPSMAFFPRSYCSSQTPKIEVGHQSLAGFNRFLYEHRYLYHSFNPRHFFAKIPRRFQHIVSSLK